MPTIYRLTPQEARRDPGYEKGGAYWRALVKAASHRKGWIKKIVWEEPGPTRGYTQWAVRPYHQLDGCNGANDEPILLIAHEFCRRHGIDLQAIIEEAYDEGRPDGWWEHIEAARDETALWPIDPWLMLEDLSDINWHPLVAALEEIFKERDDLRYIAERNYWMVADEVREGRAM